MNIIKINIKRNTFVSLNNYSFRSSKNFHSSPCDSKRKSPSYSETG